MNSNLHMYATYTKTLSQERVVIQFNTQLDMMQPFRRPFEQSGRRNCCAFGVNIDYFL